MTTELLYNKRSSNSQVQRLITNISVEMKGYNNFEFTPSTLRQLKRGTIHNPCRIVKTWVQLKNHTLHHHTEILISCTTNVNSPFMRLEPAPQSTFHSDISSTSNMQLSCSLYLSSCDALSFLVCPRKNDTFLYLEII